MVCQNIKLDVYFVGIQPAQIQLGQSISPQVSQAIQKLSKALAGIFPPKQYIIQY
jgi:Ni,Fe-hydrogenase maturation factor